MGFTQTRMISGQFSSESRNTGSDIQGLSLEASDQFKALSATNTTCLQSYQCPNLQQVYST